ncbi:MAG: glycoside hydrolase family 13 protein, partial [Oscillospiraceae bacterium]|nr:glycoside hydrolase family 13 protein [Oscillospiraceae bacterium]
MRILFDSKQLQFKDPFGTLVPGQECTLNIHIPSSVQATAVECILTREDGSPALTAAMSYRKKMGAYDVFCGKFSFAERGLYYYYFRIITKTGSFRLFKYGSTDTNMEAGGCWQVSCVPADFTTPDWAKGATMYQIFPDRFHKSGKCDLTGKLQPYTVHEKWDEEVDWRPTSDGKVLNNDFYGGNFKGITEKMPYIASLGVTILYLNPISKSFSSHRYDTGDYKTPDPMLGTEADFTAMCKAAHARGIKVILDGVYSHTGSNSLYFDKERTFGGKGAYNSKNSPYYSWYDFHPWPDSYTSWWNFDTLPTVNKMDPAFVEYIIAGEDSVVAHWLNAGADGFRLDVADELPNEFVALLKKRIREIRPDALLIGEVWEDASNKSAYGARKRYFVDGVMDSIMNYPFRTAIINFLRDRDDGR